MIKSIFKKIFFAILWLWVISILAFWLSKQVPGDEILDYLSIEGSAYSTSLNPDQQREAYERVAHKRGLDLPYFIVSVHKGIYPNSLFTIFPNEDMDAVKAWSKQSHNSDGAISLHHALREALHYSSTTSTLGTFADSCSQQLQSILVSTDIAQLNQQIDLLQQQVATNNRDTVLFQKLVNVKTQAVALSQPRSLSIRKYFPSISWNGKQNQYHQWMTGLISFQPLTSLMDGRNAWTKIVEALKWTLVLNGFAFLLAIGLGMWIGIWSGVRDGTGKEKWMSIVLFTFFAIPSFWLATLLIFLLSSGEWLTLLPPGGLGPYHGAHSIFEKWGILAVHFILPVFCLTIGSLAYISRQMKQSVLHEYSQPYVFSLRTLGVSEKTILRKHVLRNAMFPLITMMGNALPALLSGSLIIEVIFSIPGMGRLMFTSLMARDWPVVFPILMLGAAVTILAYSLTDVVYKWLDPRVKSND